MIARLVRSNILTITGTALGATAGYLYYHYVGCLSGACPITSSPVMSTLWGAVMGALLLGMFKRDGCRTAQNSPKSLFGDQIERYNPKNIKR
jgi:hypothetical protein